MKIQPIFTYYPSEQGHFATFEAPSIREILVGGNPLRVNNYSMFAKNEGALIKENKAISIFEIKQKEKIYVFFHYLPINGRYEESRLNFWIEGFYVDSIEFDKIKKYLGEIRELVRTKIQNAIGKHCHCTTAKSFYIQKQETIDGIVVPEIEIDIEHLNGDIDLYQYAICYSMELTDSIDYKEIQNPYKFKDACNTNQLGKKEQSNFLANINDDYVYISKPTQQKTDMKIFPNKNQKDIGSHNINSDEDIQILLQGIRTDVDTKVNEIISLMNQYDIHVTDRFNKQNIKLVEVFKHTYQDVNHNIEQVNKLIKNEDLIIQEIDKKCDNVLVLNKLIKSLLFLISCFLFFIIVFLFFFK